MKKIKSLIVFLLFYLSILITSHAGIKKNSMLYGKFIIKNQKWYLTNDNNQELELLKPPDYYLEDINFKAEMINNDKIFIIGYCFTGKILRPHVIQYYSYDFYFEDDNHFFLWNKNKDE